MGYAARTTVWKQTVHSNKARLLAAALIAFGSASSSMGGSAVAATLEVTVTGLEEPLADNVRAHLAIAEEAEEEVDEGRVRHLHAQAPEQIASALRPFGYYDPQIEATLERSDGGWLAHYQVDAGEPVILEEVNVHVLGAGSDEPAVRAVLASPGLASGQILRHAQYEQLKERLFEAAYYAGYLDAVYDQARFEVRRLAREADVHLVLETGSRYYFGEVTVDQELLHPEFMGQFVAIEPGDPFDASRLIDLQLSLTDSGYFSSASLDIRRGEAVEEHIPVVVRTTPRPSQEYTLGVGYASDDGPRLNLGMALRRVNRRGHRFRADLHLSGITSTASVDYQIPVRNVATDYLSYTALLGTRDIGDWETEQLVFAARWNDLWRNLQRRMYVEARRERFRVPGVLEQRSENLLYPGFWLSSQQAEDPLFTRRGRSWSADFRFGSKALLSSTDFARLSVAGSLVRPLGPRARFLWRGEYGAIAAADLDRLPPSQRFFAGGERSVRGYQYEQLAPTVDGATVGGRYLFTTSVELDFLIVGDYGAAVFFDAGNAADEPWPRLMRGAGIGLRWRSPVGMVSIDLAHPFDDPDTDVRLHLSVGSGL